MAVKQNKLASGVDKLIERQVRNWELSQSAHKKGQEKIQEVADFVTIGNSVGAGGLETANLLAERLDWPVFGRSILTQMAGDDKTLELLYRNLDERDETWLENAARSLLQRDARRNDYFPRLCRTILTLARKGPAIFIGRSADLILPRDRGLRVKVIASFDYCVQNFAKYDQISIEEATRQVKRIEKERSSFVQNRFHIDAYEPSRYDLLINTEEFTPEQRVEIIMEGMRIRKIIN